MLFAVINPLSIVEARLSGLSVSSFQQSITCTEDLTLSGWSSVPSNGNYT